MNEETGRPDNYSKEPSRDVFSYSRMGLASEKWVRGENDWERPRYRLRRMGYYNLGLILLMMLSLAAFVLCSVLDMGWDNFLTMLGW